MNLAQKNFKALFWPSAPPLLPQPAPPRGEKATFILASVTHTIRSGVTQTQGSQSAGKSEVSMHRDLGKTN